MRINKSIINSKDWKTKVIIGYVLIIALFCIATSWILFITIPDALHTLYDQDDPSNINAILAPIQVFGFGLLLVILLIASLLSYWSYSAALNSVERTERAITSFMGNSSHEMKTPVASIKLLSESIVIAANRGQTDYVKEFAGRIEQESDHLEKLVRDMLSITRTSAPLKARPCSMSPNETEDLKIKEIIEEALLTQEPMAQKKGLELVTYFGDGLDGLAIALAAQDFLTIVNNLVGNAVAYTDSGRITIEARSTKDTFTFRVSDTGCGIARHDQDRVFERFYRVDSTRTSYAQGTGLGLPLVSSIIANAGGRIKLDSELGQGSTFTVVLPVKVRKSDFGSSLR